MFIFSNTCEACLTFFLFFFCRNGFFRRETALSQKCFKIIISPVRLFFKKHDNNNNNNVTTTHSEEDDDKRRRKWTHWRRRNVSSAIQRGFVFNSSSLSSSSSVVGLQVVKTRIQLPERLVDDATFTTQKMTSTTLSTQTRKNWKRLKLWLSFSTSAHPSTLTRTRSMCAWKMSQTPRLKCIQ